MARDWIFIRSDPPEGQEGRVLLATPHEIGVQVTHHAIQYGMILEGVEHGYVLKLLKQTIFRAVRDTITELSSAR